MELKFGNTVAWLLHVRLTCLFLQISNATVKKWISKKNWISWNTQIQRGLALKSSRDVLKVAFCCCWRHNLHTKTDWVQETRDETTAKNNARPIRAQCRPNRALNCALIGSWLCCHPRCPPRAARCRRCAARGILQYCRLSVGFGYRAHEAAAATAATLACARWRVSVLLLSP